ncbi:hypothetical protein ED733_001091 [Metarhizium rileyi]|uniref:Uncharacterized protein n=1 Tax=Metarhizium rileyi (strain RCEF 4871) TaxID=1649241 RepID=A0A5C6GH19_METRR|nr:hypothetical protein ED733_001091 [Metarhizium rileyi]
MASRRQNLRPASTLRKPQRYQGKVGADTQPQAASRRYTTESTSSPVQPQIPDLGRYCAFPTRSLDDPDPGPSELVKALRRCTTNDEREDLDAGLSAAHWWESREKSAENPNLTPKSPRTALVARLPPLSSWSPESPDGMEIPLIPDEIDWGSDPENGQSYAYPDTSFIYKLDERPSSQWNRQKMFYPFAIVVVEQLHLTSFQIQTFLANYQTEKKVWEAYEMNVARIPHGELVQQAAKSCGSIADLMNLHRPTLSTDSITRTDVDMAIEYAARQHLDTDTEDLEGCMGSNTHGFVDLDITDATLGEIGDMIRDRREQYFGWIDRELINAEATARAERMAAEADDRCLINDGFLGTAQKVIPRNSTPEAGQDAVIPDGIHVTPRRNRLIRSGMLVDITKPVQISLLDHRGPSEDMQLMRGGSWPESATGWDMGKEANMTFGQQNPAPLIRSVPGDFVATALEGRTTDQGPLAVEVRSNCLQPQILQVGGSKATTAMQRRPDAPGAKHSSRGIRLTAPATTQIANTSLRRQTHYMQALQNLIKPCRAVQGRSNALFGSAARSEVSAVVSGALSAGYQSLSNRQKPPGRTQGRRQAVGDAMPPLEVTRHGLEASDVCKIPVTDAAERIAAVSSPTVDGRAVSVQLRQELDTRWAHYLRAENKVPAAGPKINCSAPAAAVEDDPEYTPKDNAANKRKPSVQVQKTPTKRRKSGTAPEAPAQPRFCEVLPGGASEPIKPLNLIPIPRKQTVKQGGTAVSSTMSPWPRPTLPDPPCAPQPSNAGPDSSEPSKGKKNTEPIFGLQRNQELASPADSAENAEYAWSAETAEFAAVSETARYALKANSLAGGGLVEAAAAAGCWPEEALAALGKLKDEFDSVEFEQRGSATRHARKSKFAGCADWALYAHEATTASFALEVAHDSLVEADQEDVGGS